MGDENKGYNDTKEFVCTGCGKTITLTKFASQKNCKCDECKTNGVPVNSEIVAKALAGTKPKVSLSKPSTTSGETKELPCIKCGNLVTVTKFASAKKVLCDDCKGTGIKASDIEVNDDEDGNIAPRKFHVDSSKIKWDQIKSLEEYRINEITIANKKLQKVVCPACGHQHMKMLVVVDSAQFGIVAKYQCPSCMLTMTISEQAQQLSKTMKPGHRYNYNGEEMEKLASTMDDTRLSNSVRYLLKICHDNGIKVDGFELPQYYFNEEKPVPVGFIIPPEDTFQHTVNSIINGLTNASRQGNTTDEPEGSRYITISDTLAKKMVYDLGKLLKED